MFWKRKVPKIIKGDLTTLEKKVVEILCGQKKSLSIDKISKQFEYLPLKRRIEYKHDSITELYPEKFDSIPNDLLLGRTEEFLLAEIKFDLNGDSYVCEMHAVLGAVFDIKIRPKPPKKIHAKIELIDININDELNKNIY